MDLNRLSTGEKVLGASSLLLIVLSFFPLWAKYEARAVVGFGGGSERVSAWNGDAFNILTKLGLILTLLVLILVLAKAAGGLDNVNLPAPLGLIYLGLAGIAAILIVLTAVIGPRETFQGVDITDAVEVSRGPVLYVGALLSLAMAAGAFMHFSGGETTTRPAGGPPGGPPPGPPGT